MISLKHLKFDTVLSKICFQKSICDEYDLYYIKKENIINIMSKCSMVAVEIFCTNIPWLYLESTRRGPREGFLHIV